MIQHATTGNTGGWGADDVRVEHGEASTNDATSRIVGNSLPIRDLRTQIGHLASFDVIGNPHVPSLLLQGETGTGKGLVARVVHDSGPRVCGPFLEVNCAAIPEALIEAELFGFEAGAFTDAKRAKPGLFHAASGGTLFLDEVDALSLLLQRKLLTAIESKRVRRLGAVRDQAIDVKLIAATPTSLSAQVSAGRFRADLYHRLVVVLLVLPPLRERGDDILVLAQHFLRHYGEAHHLPSKRLSGAAKKWLLRYNWPGNVRELDHLMERVTLLSQETIIDFQTLERLCLLQTEPTPQTGPAPVGADTAPLDEPVRIREVLLQAEGNVMRTARLLGMSRGSLRYRMQQYGIEREGCKELPQLCESLARGLTPPARLPAVRGRRRFAHPVNSQEVTRDALASQAQPEFEPCCEQRAVALLAISVTLPIKEDVKSPPDAPWLVVARWRQLFIRQLTGFGGIILQRSPSLVIAAFGLTGMFEQLPKRAVQAAVAIRRAIVELKKPDAEEAGVEIRLAIHLGMALVDVQRRIPPSHVLPMADALTSTLQLLGAAAPGEILLSPQARHQVKEWYTLQAQEVLLGDRLLHRTSAYVVVEEVSLHSLTSG